MIRSPRSLAAALMLFMAPSLFAHLIVDVRMLINAPSFVPVGQPFSYSVIADDVNNDNGFGIVVNIPLPTGVSNATATGNGFICSPPQSGTIHCSAEQVVPGPNIITVRATAPATPSTLRLSTDVQSLGSFDPKSDNDRAQQSITAYDPRQCTSSSPVTVGPAENTTLARVASLSWTPSAGATQYRVKLAQEGEAPAIVLTTTATSGTVPVGVGSAEWSVEAVFDACPPLPSPKAHFTSTASGVVYQTATFAGNAAVSDSVDGDLSTATFTTPFGLTFDAVGTLFVTDADAHVVRQISNGQVTTIVGMASVGGTAEGQFARLFKPHGITNTSLDGYTYVADTGNNDVRILYTTPGGPFVPAFTVAGAAGQPGYVDKASTDSRMNAPQALVSTERGTLYVADTGNDVVRKMTPIIGFVGNFDVTTIARGFNGPAGITVAPDGTLFVADTRNNVIRRIDASGAATTLSATAPPFNLPTALALDGRGNLYVCDTGNHLLRKIAPSGFVTTLTTVDDPNGVAVAANGDLFVTDSKNHRILIISATAAPAPAGPGGRAPGRRH